MLDWLYQLHFTCVSYGLKAEKVDAALHGLLMKLEPQRQHLACLGTWVLYHNLRIMIHYLLSGFELELYSMHEYYYIYWWVTSNRANTYCDLLNDGSWLFNHAIL